MAPSPRRGPPASLHPSSDPATPSGWRSSRRELFERVVQALPSLTGNGRDRSTAPCRRMGSFCGPGHATTFPFVSPSRLSSASKPCRQLARRKTPIQAAALGPSRHRTGSGGFACPASFPAPHQGPVRLNHTSLHINARLGRRLCLVPASTSLASAGPAGLDDCRLRSARFGPFGLMYSSRLGCASLNRNPSQYGPWREASSPDSKHGCLSHTSVAASHRGSCATLSVTSWLPQPVAGRAIRQSHPP